VRDSGDGVAVEMDDPTQGGRVEVLLEDVFSSGSGGAASEEEEPHHAQPQQPQHRLQHRAPRLTLAPSVKLVDVYASDEVSSSSSATAGAGDVNNGSSSSGGGGGVGGGGGGGFRCLPSLFGRRSSSSSSAPRSIKGHRHRHNVVDGVTLSAYDGQVLALLGHSGSGKSALLELMSGQRPRSGGEMDVFGGPVRVKWSPSVEGVSVGLCTQHAASEGLLTPREHLAFYAQLHRQTLRSESASVLNGYHSLPTPADRDALEALLRDAGLADHANKAVKDLDLGSQRALQVALAFAGAALGGGGGGGGLHGGGDGVGVVERPRQLVLLDEPTGDDMDPALQKTVWGLIRSRHAGATVVVATRSVSEAGALADRMALISHGRVKCCGGPTFLRRLFGLGYRLHVTFKPPTQTPPSSTSGVMPAMDEGLSVLSTVRKHCPGAEMFRGQPSDGGGRGGSNNSITLSLAGATAAAAAATTTMTANGNSNNRSNNRSNGSNGSDGGGGGGDVGNGSGGGGGSSAVRLGPMLADLEQSADHLGIIDVALEATSLDEVFALLGQEAEEESETLLPLDASSVALDFGDEALGMGLLSASEGDVNADDTNSGGRGGSAGFG